ncbi:hypothetical protein KC351_g9651 [Hortaea werneckii]|nr:hypothetical protein KC351_g9651 [Hortaea werneckii]
MKQQAIYNDAVAPLPTSLHSERDFANTAISKERLCSDDHTPKAPSKKMCFIWYHTGHCDRNPERPTKPGKLCPYLHSLTANEQDTKLSHWPKFLHRKPCGLPLCPLKDVTWQKTQPKDAKAQKGTCVAGSSAGCARASKKRELDEVTTSTIAKRPRKDQAPAAKVRQRGKSRDDPLKSSARQTNMEYDEYEGERVSSSEGVTCFFWYHGRCSRAADRGCDYLHCLTDPPSMVQPPPGYVHAKPCILPWCPGDSPAKTIQSNEKSESMKTKKGRPGKKRVEYSLYSKRVDEQEQLDFEGDDDQSDVSEAPSCGQELFTGEDWYLKGFE